MDRIIARGLKFYGHHGVTPEERAAAQPFEVDVTLYRDLRKAGHSDCLEDTVDYSRVFRAVKSIMEEASYSLVEVLAENIAAQLLTFDMVMRAAVQVKKLQPPIEGEYRYFGVGIDRERTSSLVYIGLGSNLGDRASNLAKALDRMANMPATVLVKKSSVYNSEPWGKTDQPEFLNQAAAIETRLTPEELLRELQTIENALGRIRNEKWGSRSIDLDILLFGDLLCETPELTIPHPYLTQRPFVMAPLVEIEPSIQLPDGQLLRNLLITLK